MSRCRPNCLIPPLLLVTCLTLQGAVVSLSSLTGPALSGSFEFNGSLGVDGEFNFATDGSPLANPLFTVPVQVPVAQNFAVSSSGTLAGSFSMGAGLSNGTYNFSSAGAPLTSPSFTTASGTFSNLPNQNDRYEVGGGSVTALKYDLANSSAALRLQLDGTYVISSGPFDVVETGTYSVASSGGPSTTTENRTFSNQPNQNDRYLISGGQTTALKYDLSSGPYQLQLRLDGTFELLSGMTSLGSGTYELTPVPEPEAIPWLGAGVLGFWAGWRRCRRG